MPTATQTDPLEFKQRQFPLLIRLHTSLFVYPVWYVSYCLILEHTHQPGASNSAHTWCKTSSTVQKNPLIEL